MRKNLFLYLAIACFLALIAIFIVDGYLGVYDTVYITAGERQEMVEPDYWLQRHGFEIDYYVHADWGQKIFFRYEIDNRRCSDYSTLIQASVWQENEKVFDLFSEEKSIESFDEVTVEWTLLTEELDFSVGGRDQYTVKINHGEVERSILVSLEYPIEMEPVYPKAVPVPES